MELWGPWWNRQHIFFQGVVLQLPIASKCGLIVLFAKAKGVYKTQEREGVAFGDLCRGLSVWEFNAFKNLLAIGFLKSSFLAMKLNFLGHTASASKTGSIQVR